MQARSTAVTHVLTGRSRRPVRVSRRSQRDAREASSLGRCFCRTRVVLSPTALGFIPRKPLAPPPRGAAHQRAWGGALWGRRAARGLRGRRRSARLSFCADEPGCSRTEAAERQRVHRGLRETEPGAAAGLGPARSGPGFPERGSCGHEDRRGGPPRPRVAPTRGRQMRANSIGRFAGFWAPPHPADGDAPQLPPAPAGPGRPAPLRLFRSPEAQRCAMVFKMGRLTTADPGARHLAPAPRARQEEDPWESGLQPLNSALRSPRAHGAERLVP